MARASFTFTLPLDLGRQLEELVASKGKTTSGVVGELITELLTGKGGPLADKWFPRGPRESWTWIGQDVEDAGCFGSIIPCAIDRDGKFTFLFQKVDGQKGDANPRLIKQLHKIGEPWQVKYNQDRIPYLRYSPGSGRDSQVPIDRPSLHEFINSRGNQKRKS